MNQKPTRQKSKPAPKAGRPKATASPLATSRNGQGLRTQRRTQQMVKQVIDGANLADSQTRPRPKKSNLFGGDLLKIAHLGGQDDVGSKNMILIEYDQDALVIDCGISLGLDLPGINYAIPDISYLRSIQTKLRGYVLTHGHLDHIGALPHVLVDCPAPIYGSIFTIGMAKKVLANQSESAHLVDQLKFNVMNMDGHERLVVGKSFKVELVRVTHAIPESSAAVIDTPVGRLISTGDFRLDPEPLDRRPTDTARLKTLGQEGVLLLMSDSTNAQQPGRVPTEHTLQNSFDDIIAKTKGRLFIASFSSNINRVQMIINAAARGGRQVAFDGRSMIQHVELAVKLGLLKVPKGTIVSVANLASLPDDRLLMMCTGGQGEPGASLQRMSLNEHKHVNLRPGDAIVISSKPIPGNEIAYQKLSANLVNMGCKVFKAPTWEIDGAIGPLHVSGHGQQDEHREMIDLTRPDYLVPVHAAADRRQYHCQLAQEQAGLKPKQTLMVNNGDLVAIDKAGQVKITPEAVPCGSVLVDDAGQQVPGVVVKDRLLLTESGLVVVVLTINRANGQLLASPDIVTRGFIHIRDNEELMQRFRTELKRAVNQRFSRVPIDRFKTELKDHATNFLYNQTKRSPIVIPVINVVSGNGNGPAGRPAATKARAGSRN